MAVRNAHRVGDHLKQDDESGFVHYASEMVERWDGSWVHHTQYETRQPQEFVQARNDPKPLRHVRPEPDVTAPLNVVPGVIGETNIGHVQSPAGHIFGAGIGGMTIDDQSNPNTVFEVS